MRKLVINGGNLTLTTDEPLTLADITHLAELAVEAKIPATAEVVHISVNFRNQTQPFGSEKPTLVTWEVSIAWRMPIPEINVTKEW